MSKLFRHVVILAVVITVAFLATRVMGQSLLDLTFNQVDLSHYDAHPIINEIAQDRDGFIWIASEFGLYRFDGVNTQHFTISNFPALPGNMINSVLSDSDGRLWIATNGGLVVMDIENGVSRLITLGSDSEGNDLIPTQLFKASDASMWVGLNNNSYTRIIEDQPTQIWRLEYPEFLLGECFEVVSFKEDSNGNVFVEADCGYGYTVFLIERRGNQYNAELVHSGPIGMSNMLMLDGTPFLVFRSRELVQFNYSSRKFDFEGNKIPIRGISDIGVTTIMEKEAQSCYLGTVHGEIWHIAVNDDTTLTRYIGRAVDARVLAMMTDMSGCVWIGTGDGVYYFSPRTSSFSRHLNTSSSDEQYGLRMRGIVENVDGLIYTCTQHGLYRLNPMTRTADKVQSINWNISLPYSMCLGTEEYMWVGSDGYGLMKFNFIKNEFYDRISPFARTNSLTGKWVGELVNDSDGTLFVGTDNGIMFKTRNSDELNIAMDFNNNPILQNVSTHDIKIIKDKQYWMGTNDGLYQVNQVGHLPDAYFVVYRHDNVPFKIREICLTAGSDVWLATEDAGLVHYYPGDRSHVAFTEANGLPNEVLYSLLPGPTGELWIGTLEGLSRFDTSTQLFNNFYVSDGLPHNEFNSHSQLIASDGTFYFGTQNGMVSFDPSEFSIDSSDLPMMFDGVRLHNTKVDSIFERSRYTQLTDVVRIGPHDNLVTITYSIADFHKPGGNRFQYMLEGLSSKWHYVGNQTELVLPHLSAGDYNLHIRGAGSDGRWSTQEAVIPIEVYAAFYNTWWFRLCVLAALVGIMWLIHQYRLNQVLKIQSMRLRIAEDLHDELGSSLTGIGIQTELLTATEPSPQRASRLQGISGHIHDAVSKLGDIVWALQSDTASVGDLMDRIEEQAHMMLDHGKIESHISLPTDHKELLLADIVKQNCFLIFKEAVTNIVKHSNADRVDISLSAHDGRLLLSVTDNGKIISTADTRGGGNGLRNMKRRAIKMGGQLTITQDDGFKVELVVPKAFTG